MLQNRDMYVESEKKMIFENFLSFDFYFQTALIYKTSLE